MNTIERKPCSYHTHDTAWTIIVSCKFTALRT